MKIQETRPGTATGKPGKKTTSHTAGGFGRLLEAAKAEGNIPVAQTGDITETGALLSLQEVDERAEANKKACRHGETLLHELEKLRLMLITGQVAPETLQKLARQLEALPQRSADPALARIIDEIEIRVAVEIAKWERDRG